MVYKIVLYGAGRRCKNLCRIIQQTNIEIVAIVDNDSAKWGEEVEGYRVLSPDKVIRFTDTSLCITIADFNITRQIRRELQQIYHYDLQREISYNKLILKSYKENLKVKDMILDYIRNKTGVEAILFDCYTGINLGGIEAWTIDICESLIKSGKKDVYIISDKGNYQVPHLIEKQVINVDIEHDVNFSMSSVLNIIKAIMGKIPCKVITRTVDPVMLAAYLIKQYYPDMVEIISVIHGGSEKIYEEYMDFQECTDIYIGVSQDIRNDMISKGIEPEKVYAMTCPFLCEPILNRTYTEDVLLPIHIGYAGRMDGMEYSQKRMDLLLQLVRVLEKKQISYNMELAGDGPVRKEMEEFVYANGLREKVHFLGRLERSELSAFWKRQDICINLADYEGRSISIIEAMGNGAVPVVTATSGVNEDIKDGLNGYIVPIGDYLAAAEKIEFLAKHRERLSGMGQLAHDAVYPKSLMEPHLKLWKRILKLV